MSKYSLEKEIREGVNNLTTYRVGNSNRDLVSVKGVERVLNLVFRGHRDKDLKIGQWVYNDGAYKCEFCHHEITGREEDLNYCCKCGAKLESEVK